LITGLCHKDNSFSIGLKIHQHYNCHKPTILFFGSTINKSIDIQPVVQTPGGE